MKLSVICCTHNAQADVLLECIDRIFKSLARVQDYEVLLIDNASEVPLLAQAGLKIDKRPQCKVIREEHLGLTAARLRGIRESTGDLLVFVDDDNFVEPEFFRNGLEVAENYPWVGAYSGNVQLLFDHVPPSWTKPYWGLLVHRVIEKDRWSNLPEVDETMPCGAGLFVRRSVASHYVHLHDSGMRDIQLDRTGRSLFSGGDNDMASCACDIGLGVGLFARLKIQHYIPERRTRKDYLLSLTKGIHASSVVLRSYRSIPIQPISVERRILNYLKMLFYGPTKRAFLKAASEGEMLGRQMLAEHRK